MKQATLAVLAGLAVGLAGCVVTSVHPFFTDKDLVFEPGLVGNWLKEVKDEQPEVWKFEKNGELSYRFTIIEKDKATVMEAHAFKLQNQLFVDVFSIDKDIHVIPPHYLLKVTQLTPNLQMSELDNDWLKGMLASDPGAAAHCLVSNGDKPDDVRVVLTGATAELQKFVLAHMDTDGAWKASLDLRSEGR